MAIEEKVWVTVIEGTKSRTTAMESCENSLNILNSVITLDGKD